MRSVSVRIKGRVQGVGYRAWTRRTALGLGLSGWVRNRADGSVEAVLQGPNDAVESMLAQCRSGPPSAHVSDIAIADGPPGAVLGFEMRPTI